MPDSGTMVAGPYDPVAMQKVLSELLTGNDEGELSVTMSDGGARTVCMFGRY